MARYKLKYILPALLALILFGGTTALAASQNMVVSLPKNQTINNDYFASGSTVDVDGTVNGDVYAVGGQIIVDGTINGDVIAAGGTVTIAGTVNGNVRAAGGTVTITGTVTKNMTLGGGNLQISGSANIGGNIVAAGGTLLIAGPVKGNLMLGGGAVTLTQSIGGGVNAEARQLVLESGARIGGSLNYWSQTSATITSGAKVIGMVTRHEHPVMHVSHSPLTFSLLWVLFTVIIGFIALAIFPNFADKTTHELRDNLWPSLGWGALALVAAPPLAVLLCLTIIGIPFGILLLAFYGLSLLFAPIWTALFVGIFGGHYIGVKNKFLALLVGVVALALVELVPILGGVVWLVAIALGLGASLRVTTQLFGKLKTDKVI